MIVNKIQSCDFRWVTGPWEGCSHTCGADGVQMRMIYCVRTAMVTHKLPVLETKEARRLPEVTDDDFMSVINTTDTPQVDAWKATIKDHKVNYI